MNKEKVILSPNELADKKSNATKQVLALSVEYMLAGVAEEYCKKAKIESLKDFNDKNQMGWTQVLVNPFFIATSNGHSEALYNLFGQFQSQTYGPASTSIYHLIKKDDGNYKDIELKFFKINSKESPFKLEVLDTKPDNSFSEIKTKIKSQQIKFDDSEEVYSNISILPDRKDKYEEGSNNTESTPLYKTIQKGIDIISKQSVNFFGPNSDTIVLFKASYFNTYRKSIAENKFSIIPYSDIQLTRDKPFQEVPESNSKIQVG